MILKCRISEIETFDIYNIFLRPSPKELANQLKVAGSRQDSLQSFSVGINSFPLKKIEEVHRTGFLCTFRGAALSVKYTGCGR